MKNVNSLFLWQCVNDLVSKLAFSGLDKACTRPWHPAHYSGRTEGHQRQTAGGAEGGVLGNREWRGGAACDV